MGAKAAFAVAVDGEVRDRLRGAEPDAPAAAALLTSWLPGPLWEQPELSTLDDTIFPGSPIGALRVPGLDLVCSEDVASWIDGPPQPVLEAARGRRLTVFFMHSVTDSLLFAVWEDGVRVRLLAVDSEGVHVDEGARLAEEEPFWAGEHPVEGEPGDEAWAAEGFGDDEPYPLPFHPLDLGEEVLRRSLGVVLEGLRQPEDLDPWDVPVLSFVPRAPEPSPVERRGWFGRRSR